MTLCSFYIAVDNTAVRGTARVSPQHPRCLSVNSKPLALRTVLHEKPVKVADYLLLFVSEK